ncbi:hypothetical protein [Actinoplanes sp. CA-252034]|uniref:hypothetical protein n=1 Tax=Actinoplanes sp. CA-252034 TaxID=3239906 RepID=UPI003D9611C6
MTSITAATPNRDTNGHLNAVLTARSCPSRIATRRRPHTISADRSHTFVTARLDACVGLRDVQIAARHADPRATIRYDRHPNHILATFMASGTQP